MIFKHWKDVVTIGYMHGGNYRPATYRLANRVYFNYWCGGIVPNVNTWRLIFDQPGYVDYTASLN